MEDFVFVLDEEVAVTAGGGGSTFGTLDTGVYDFTVVTATAGKTRSGNNKLDLALVTADGHELQIWQAFVMDQKWKTGSENFGYADWQAFASVTGMKSFTTFQKPLLKEDGSPVQKNGADIILNAVKELEGVKVKLAIQKEFDVYNNEVSEDNVIFASFTPAGANASEKINGDTTCTALGKLDGRLNDKKTKRFKAFEANGGTTTAVGTSTEEEPEEEEIDL